ncbi:WD40 repeat domain-containing protein [Catellatospora bangladeshensis]|uniref:WD40 repeat domain-containing protein n=1 Tax=Catellatospora bangladeshensis TaxID=310355 RepID=UPI003609755E
MGPGHRPLAGPALHGHHRWLGAVTAIASDSGAPMLITAGGDGTIRSWDPSEHRETLTLQPHIPSLFPLERWAAVSFTGGDGQPLTAISHNADIEIWDPRAPGKPIRALVGHTGNVYSMDVWTAPDGTVLIVSTGFDSTVRIWDPNGVGQVGQPLYGSGQPVHAVRAFADGNGRTLLVAAGEDRTVRVLDPAMVLVDNDRIFDERTQPIRAATLHNPHPYGVVHHSVTFTGPGGRTWLATSCGMGNIAVWHPDRPNAAEYLLQAPAPVNNLAVLPDSGGMRLLVGSSQDGEPRVWHPHRRWRRTAPVKLLRSSLGEPVRLLQTYQNPSGQAWLAAWTGERILVWLAADLDHPVCAIDEQRPVRSMAFIDAEDGLLLTAYRVDDGVLTAWRLPAGEPWWEAPAKSSSVVTFRAGNGTIRIATVNHDGRVCIWDPRSAETMSRPLHAWGAATDDWVSCLCQWRVGDRTWLVVARGRGTSSCWIRPTARSVWSFRPSCPTKAQSPGTVGWYSPVCRAGCSSSWQSVTAVSRRCAVR